MNIIQNALTQGYSHQNVIQYLLRHFPHAKKQIETALARGFSPENIIKYLSGGRNEVNAPMTAHEKTRKSDLDKQKNLEKRIGQGAALAAGAFAGGRAIQVGLGALGQGSGNNPGNPSPQVPQAPQAPQAPTPTSPLPQNAPINPSPAPQVGPNVGQQAQAQVNAARQPSQIAPQTISQPQQNNPQVNVGQLLQQSGLLDKIEGMRANNPPEVIAKLLRAQSGAQVKELEQAAQTPLEQIVSDYVANAPAEPAMTEKIAKGVKVRGEPGYEERSAQEPIEAKKEPPFKGLLEEGRKKFDEHMNAKEIPEPTEYMPKKEKGSTVALPTGEIGEITDIRQGIATVNAQGKEYRRKVEDLIDPPMPEKDLADLYKDVLKGIEGKTGQEVSRMVSWAGYDPKTNELAFVPHTGALYVYDNISPEDSAQLTNILTQRKSTGENFIGAWNAGTDSPIGAGMSQLIQKLQKERGGKGNEYKGKYEKIYDALEPAKLAAKQKHAEQKKSEKGASVKEKKEPPKKEEEPKEKITLAKALNKEKKEPSISKEFYQKQMEAWEKTVDRLEESHKIKYTPAEKKEVKRPEIEPHQLKKQKSFILDAIEKAIKNPTEHEKVEIDVPGDGTFKINNDKETLEKFFDRVDKKWPSGPMPSGEPKPYERKPLKKEQKVSAEVSETMPRPFFKQFEFENKKGETKEHEGNVYDDVLALFKTEKGFNLTHIPSGVHIRMFKKEKTAKDFIKLLYQEKALKKGFKKAKTMQELQDALDDEAIQKMADKFREE